MKQVHYGKMANSMVIWISNLVQIRLKNGNVKLNGIPLTALALVASADQEVLFHCNQSFLLRFGMRPWRDNTVTRYVVFTCALVG